MAKQDRIEYRSLGSLLDDGVINLAVGFPFGGHNDADIGIPHIRPFNVTTSGEISLRQVKSVPETAASTKPRLRRNDLVFNNTNTKELVGKCAVWDRDSEPVFSNHMTRIRVTSDSCNPTYLSYAILYHWMTGKSEMLARAHVAQASIIGERFREIEVAWHAPSEQGVISSLISQVRNASRLEEQQEEVVIELKRAAMRELFTRGLRGEAQKETEIGLMPESWEVVRLETLGKIGNGSTPKKSISGYWEGGTFPWLTSAKVYDREIEVADQFVTQQALDECHLPLVKPGAVLIAITGQGKTLGNAAVLKIEATINQHLAYLQTDTSKANPSFIRGYLETQYDYLRQIASGGGSTKGALTCAFLRSLPVPLPAREDSLEEQRDIVALLDAIDRKIALHRQKRAVLEELFRALLHKLMTGEIRVADLNLSALVAQPAEVARGAESDNEGTT